jgi:methionyl-tRNA synthetase
MAEQRVMITSALPYVNGVKHLGNLVGSLLPADVFHRWLDILGIENTYICGTDEHGAVTELAALQEKLTPREYADKYHKTQADIYSKWGFDFTFFGRTSSETNHRMTQLFFNVMNKNGYIAKGKMNLPFCKVDRRFLTDRYIEGTCPVCGYAAARGDQCESCGKLLDPVDLKNPYCTICKQGQIEFRKQEHLFLDLAKLSPELDKWLAKNKHWPQNVRSTASAWLKEGLKPRCITRNLSWGVKVPLKGYSDLVFYVWFDAPIAYVSMTAEAKKDWKKWWTKGAKVYHFLGKDNIPFHSIFWPAMVMAAKGKDTNFELPHYVAGYEFLNWEGKKFSTSKGVGIFSDEALDLFPADYWRYYLSSILPEKKDSNFEWKDFQEHINSELLSNYGNLFYRVTSFIEKYFKKVPRQSNPGKPETELMADLAKTTDRIKRLVTKVRLRDALKETMAFSNAVNSYFQAKEPWFAIKSKTTRRDAGNTLFFAVNSLAAITLMLAPYIPSIAKVGLEALGVPKLKWEDIGKLPIKSGSKVRSLILVQKLEDEEIESAKRGKMARMAEAEEIHAAHQKASGKPPAPVSAAEAAASAAAKPHRPYGHAKKKRK